jgi:hypothetical protein
MSAYVDKAGKYKARVVAPRNGWFGEAGKNETPFIRVPLVVVGGDQDGREIVWQGWLTDAAFDNTIKSASEAFGWDGDLQALSSGEVSFEGKECEIVCDTETFEGKPRVKVKWLNNINGGGGKAMDDGKVSSLIKRLQSKSKAIAKATASERKQEDDQPY